MAAHTQTNHVTPPQEMHQAAAAYACGAWPAAERLCRQILALRGDCFDALALLGIIAAQTRRTDEAAALLGRAVVLKPGDAEARNNYANVLTELKRFDEALDSYGCALKLRPDYAVAHNNRGNALQALKRFDDALTSYERALKLEPDYAEAYNNRGNALQKLRRFDEALDSYERALKLRPDHAEAHNNRGVTLYELKRFDEALASYERALLIRPEYAEAYNNRGITFQELKRFEDALGSYERTLRLRPDHAEAHNNRGVTLQELKRFGEAAASYERALQVKPDYEWLHGTWLHARLQLCDWSSLASRTARLAGEIEHGTRATPPFPVLGLIDSLSLQRRAAQTWVNERHPATSLLPAIARRHRRARIRVGYYSPDYHDHPVAYLIAGLFERHDRENFELVAFSYGPDKRDAMRGRLAAAFDQFLDVRAKSDLQVARMSRELEIDIAVDLSGFTQDGRTGIFSHRAAPIQVNYLGYSGTMGAPYMDYIVADETLIPPESIKGYSEKIAFLPDTYQVNDRKRQIADKVFSRSDLGLPSTGFVFCCFNNTYKITPGTFDSWMCMLSRVEGSVLWLAAANEMAADNLRMAAERRHVDGGRLLFAPRLASLPEHLARYRAAGLFIDTLPYNAHATASDALWAGLPVLTQTGESYAARVAASLLNAGGLPELITTTPQQFEATAIELACNPNRLAQIRERLNGNRLTTPLFDVELFTRHLEDAYTQMYKRYLADSGPEHIYVHKRDSGIESRHIRA